ncbi:hypothetical protein H1R20_g356, partial [Candolleomyces eurysporus]
MSDFGQSPVKASNTSKALGESTALDLDSPVVDGSSTPSSSQNWLETSDYHEVIKKAVGIHAENILLLSLLEQELFEIDQAQTQLEHFQKMKKEERECIYGRYLSSSKQLAEIAKYYKRQEQLPAVTMLRNSVRAITIV